MTLLLLWRSRDAAYNNIPKDVDQLLPPERAFEAQSVSEFGDEVGLVRYRQNSCR